MSITKTVNYIQSKSKGFKPKIGIILGSGLGSFVDVLIDPISYAYEELVGFPSLGVSGHEGKLVFGNVKGTNVVVLQGRVHYYESGKPDEMTIPIQTLAALGCETLILTNSAGSLMKEATPGSVMLLTDHINFTGVSPLFGEKGISRFVDMAEAYDPELRIEFERVAEQNSIQLHKGVYIWFCGPNFETPAEIRAAKTLGADAVGMSTVPEVILARHAGLKVAALSIITNMAAGMSDDMLSHEQTIENANKGVETLKLLLVGFLESYS